MAHPRTHVSTRYKHIETFVMDKTLFAYQEKVWIYIDPVALNDPTDLPIFEGVIESIKTGTVLEHGRQVSVKHSYAIDVGDLDSLVHRDGDKVFKSRLKAAEYAIYKLREQSKNAKELHRVCEQAIFDLHIILYPEHF